MYSSFVTKKIRVLSSFEHLSVKKSGDFFLNCSCMLMSHHEEPKVTEDEEPPTEQDKRKKMVSYKPHHLSLSVHL